MLLRQRHSGRGVVQNPLPQHLLSYPVYVCVEFEAEVLEGGCVRLVRFFCFGLTSKVT